MTKEKYDLYAEIYSLCATAEKIIDDHFQSIPEYLNKEKREGWEGLCGIVFHMYDRLKAAQELAGAILHGDD